MKKVIAKNYKFILGIVIGLIWSSGIAYAATILFDSDEVSYDNTTSGLSATNVQSALDELYVESISYQLFESRVSSIESKLYPVGSYYETFDSSFNPNTSFGGTWISTTIKDDYIVEEGTSGIWTYRKWNSGIAESWGRLGKAANMATPQGGCWFAGPIEYNFISGLYTDTPTIVLSSDAGTSGDGVVPSIVNRTTNGFSVYLNNVNRSLQVTVYLSVYVNGIWKTYTAPSTIYRWHRTA